MAPSLRRALLDRVLPTPESAGPEELDLLLRRGSSGVRIRALRRAAVITPAPPPELLLGLLSDPVPGVRRTAAWALGVRPPSDALLQPLWGALRHERCDAVRLAMAVAAVRQGAEVGRAWGVLHAAALRRVATFNGPRLAGQASGAGPDTVGRQWFRTLAPGSDHHGDPAGLAPLPAEPLREALRQRLDRDPEDREVLLDLAAQQHPDDLDLLLARQRLAGRRESHAICQALGEHGDPRSTAHLVKVLQAMDVDPGHGFAGRRASATALGRIGDPDSGPVLVRALADEAHDHEGRPGAGMGIQFPVRSVILAALGEAGCQAQARLLADYLSDTTGSALGGFYLPAMDALWKVARPEDLRPLLDGDPVPAANAIGVLAAMGDLDSARGHLGDAREAVATAAQDALRLAAGEGS